MVSFIKIVILLIAIAVDSTPIERQVIRTKPCTRRASYGARYLYGNFRVNTKLSGHRRTVPCIIRKRHWISRWKQGTTICPEISTSWRRFGRMTVPLRHVFVTYFSSKCFNTNHYITPLTPPISKQVRRVMCISWHKLIIAHF